MASLHVGAGIFAVLALLPGCVRLGEKGQGSADAGGPAGDGVVEIDGGLRATGCARDPETRVELCTAVDACPTLAVDHDVFPFCGMRLRGAFFDLACWCSGWVCPMGSPTTCTEARRLLESQFEAQVCAQANEGRCTQPQRDGTDAGSAPGTAGCDAECLRACGSGAGCRDVCCP